MITQKSITKEWIETVSKSKKAERMERARINEAELQREVDNLRG